MIHIKLDNPLSTNSKKVYNQIEQNLKNGYKTNQILFETNFVTNDKTLQKIKDNFQKLKNQIAFKLDK